jgi:hypothetical protein
MIFTAYCLLPSAYSSELDFPCLLIDDFQKVESVETEVHRAASGVDHADLAWVLDRAMRDEDGLLELFFLGEVFGWVEKFFAEGLPERTGRRILGYGSHGTTIAIVPEIEGDPPEHL